MEYYARMMVCVFRWGSLVVKCGSSLIRNLITNKADPDQTAGMCRLIWLYTGHTCDLMQCAG